MNQSLLKKRNTTNPQQQSKQEFSNINVNASLNNNNDNNYRQYSLQQTDNNQQIIKVQMKPEEQRFFKLFSQPQSENIHLTLKKLNKFKLFYFNPQSRSLMTWNFINLVLIYIYFLQIPITIAFENHRSQEQTQFFFEVINLPAIFIFITSILMKFKTGFYRQGVLVTKHEQIILHYLATTFVFDALAVTSICIYEFSEIIQKPSKPITYRFIIILFYLKIYQIFYIQNLITHSFDLNRRVKALCKMVLLLMKIYLICNFAACGFFYLSDQLCNPGVQIVCQNCCWTLRFPQQQFPLKQQNFAKQYVFSLYWASTTMISIGYGDIVPINEYQVLYTIVMQFGAGLIFAYYLNQIWSIIQEYNSKKSKIRIRMSTINLYMRDKNVSVQLKSRVNAYLSHFYHTKNLREKQLEKQIIGDLTPSLKELLYFESYGHIFRNHNFFNTFSNDLLLQASSKVQQVGYFQNQILFKYEQEEPVCSLHYIQKGQFSHYIISGHTQNQFQIYTQNSVVGIYSFITQMNHLSYAKAIKYSLSYNLNYPQWRKQLVKFNQDFQKFQMIKQLALYNNFYDKMNIKCFFCESNQHITEICASLKLKQNPLDLIKKYKSKTANRVKFHRFKKNAKKIMSQPSYSPKSFKVFKQEIEQGKISYKNSINCLQLSEKKKSMIYEQSNSRLQSNKLNPISSNLFQPLRPPTKKRKNSMDYTPNISKITLLNNKKNQKKYIDSQMIRQYEFNLDQQVNSDHQSSIIKNPEIDIDRIRNYEIYFQKYNASNQLISNLARRLRITKSFRI